MNSLEKLWQKGKDFLGTEYSIMGGAMSWISESSLVSAVSNAGGLGVIASGAMNNDLLSQEIRKTKEKTSKNFGINLIVLNPEIYKLIEVCVEEQVSHVIFAGGIPNHKMIQPLKDKGIKVITFAPNLGLAKRMIKNGADALIIEGSEAGGHIGSVSTSVLVQEILPHIKDVPIFVAGGIGTGDILASCLLMGAAGVQVGTLLVCTDECCAHVNFKNSFIKAVARDAQQTVQLDRDFAVIPVRAIVNKGSLEFIEYQKKVISDYHSNIVAKDEAQLNLEKYWSGSLRKAVIDGDVEYGSLMAGQVVGLVKEISSVSDILSKLISEANVYLANVKL